MKTLRVSALIIFGLAASCSGGRGSGDLKKENSKYTELEGSWHPDLSCDEINGIVAYNEWLVESGWDLARPQIKSKSKEFSINVGSGVIYFKIQDVAESEDVVYDLTGAVKGSMTVRLNDSGDVARCVYRPWFGDIKHANTTIMLEDGASSIWEDEKGSKREPRVGP